MKKFMEWLAIREDAMPTSLGPQMPQAAQPPRVPKDGDRAYSRYRGVEAEGTLAEIRPIRGDGTFVGKIVTQGKNPWLMSYKQPDGTFRQENLSVGYDEPITWDAKRNMWYAPADHD